MVGAVAGSHVGGRAVMAAADAVHGGFQRIRGDLGEPGFDALADRRRTDENRYRSVRVDFKPRRLLGAGRAAFDETPDREAVIAAADQLALEFCLIGPAEFLKAAVEGEAIIAAVDLVAGLERRDGRYPVGHVGRLDEIAATESDTIETQVLRDHVQQAFTEKIRCAAAPSPTA